MAITQFEDPTYLEACYSALFELLKAAPLPDPLKFQSTTRVVQVPDQVPSPNQPALMLVEAGIHSDQSKAIGPDRWVFGAIAVVYFRGEGSIPPSPITASTANKFIWAISRAFATRPPYSKQTLGGLVYNCWIDGDIVADVIDQQVIIPVPIKILPGPV